MKRLGIVLLATVGFAAMAHAADLPTTKAPAAAPPPNCYASFWTWLNTSASDCPIGAYGITLYGTADLGYGYQEWGTRIDPSSDKNNYGLNKSGNARHWGVTFNGLSTSVLGVKMKEDLAPLGLPGWSLIGLVEAGFNPTSGMLINGPRALSDQNVNSAAGLSTVTINGKKYNIYNDWQSTNFDSSRAGQWDNSQGFIGVSSNTWGTLTFGRTNSLSNDVTSAYDPVASIAFSQVGFSNSFAGFGNTELVRINTALTYRLAIPNVWAFSSIRLAGQAQIGGYNLDNGATQSYYGQAGFDWGNFSFDGVAGYAQNAVSLSTYGGSVTTCGVGNSGISQAYNVWPGAGCYNTNNIVKGTLSNNFGTELTGSYKWDRFKFYDGYIYANLSNPSDAYVGGFSTIANGIFVPAGAVTSTAYLTPAAATAVAAPAYAFNKVLQTVWTGVKYSVPDDWMRGWGSLDLSAGFYYQWQNNFNSNWNTPKVKGVQYAYATPAGCVGTGAFIASVGATGVVGAAGSGSKCAGALDSISFMADWKPVKRVDIYAGVMVQNVYGGLAGGYYNNQFYYNPVTKTILVSQHAFTQNVDPTIGIRIRF